MTSLKPPIEKSCVRHRILCFCEEQIDVAAVELLLGVLPDDKEKHEAALEEDLAEEGILVTNLPI